MGMNETSDPDTTQSELNHIYDLQSQTILLVAWAVSAVSLLQIIWLGAQVWTERHSVILKATRVPSVVTPVNLVIFFMILSNSGYCWSLCESWISTESSVALASFIMEGFFSVSFRGCLIAYTWIRGRPIIELVSPGGAIFVRIILVVHGIGLIAEWIVIILIAAGASNATPYNVISLTNSVLLVTSDVLVMSFYLLYLRRIRVEHHTVVTSDNKLQIISRYGCLSTTWLILWYSVSEVTTLTDWNSTDVTVQRRFLYLIPLSKALATIFICIQQLMKWSLQNQRKLNESSKITTVEKAKLKSTQHSVSALQTNFHESLSSFK
ncbi:hypothetical protein BC830DRAFT_245359 [Chytriomyces sp. MP71]|nr:hypothetical protein BC830DRAFT_245359 [Chytriomyces sp. MP71]